MSNPQEMLEKAAGLSPQIVETRRMLHAAPELSYQENGTAALAAERLKKLGFAVRGGVAETGLIADLGEGKTVAIRSDMDALPGFEANRTTYISKTPGVMHACGHDAHVAIVLAAAQLIAQTQLQGRLRIIFQPGTEESEKDGNRSAKALLEAGALSDVAALLGLHVDATIETGKAGIIATQLNSQVSLFSIDVHSEEIAGKGQDALPKANNLMTAIYKLAGELTNRGLVALSLGSCISSSQRGNILSQQVLLSGTISSTNPEGRSIAVSEMEKIIARESAEGVTISLNVNDSDTSSLQSASVIETMKMAAVDLLGENNVTAITRKTWAADFALLAGAAPASFFYLGAQIAGARRIHHQPSFDIDESGLHLGAAILALSALRLMQD